MYQEVMCHEEVESYSKFFNPNMCHVCKKSDQGNVVTCNQCYMISYCNIEHKQKDHSNHEQICTVMQNLLKSHPYFWLTVQLSLEKWSQTRREFVNLLKKALSRDLKPYEEQMILFAKSCLICHQQVNIYPCKKCWSVNYCLDHVKDFESSHRSNCKDFQLHLMLCLELRCTTIPTITFDLFPSENKPFDDMQTFCEHYVSRGYYHARQYTWTTVDYYYSDYVSGPLSLYYGMKSIFCWNAVIIPAPCYIIHIIAASTIDSEYMPHWELILHLLPHVKQLKIVLIGTELSNKNEDIPLCFKCDTVCERKFSFECRNMFYHHYVGSNFYLRPNVIIGFQADLNKWDALSILCEKIEELKCPLVLTAKSKIKSEENENLIKIVLRNSNVRSAFQGENPFSSGKPYRDLEANDVFYRNKYVVVYQTLWQRSKTFYKNRYCCDVNS